MRLETYCSYVAGGVDQTSDCRPQTADPELRIQTVASEQEDSAFLWCLRVLYTILIPC